MLLCFVVKISQKLHCRYYLNLITKHLHLIEERGRTISGSLSITISTLLGHVTHANDNSSREGAKLSIYCFTTIIGSNRIFLEDTAPLADLPVKFYLLMRVKPGAGHSPLHCLPDIWCTYDDVLHLSKWGPNFEWNGTWWAFNMYAASFDEQTLKYFDEDWGPKSPLAKAPVQYSLNKMDSFLIGIMDSSSKFFLFGQILPPEQCLPPSQGKAWEGINAAGSPHETNPPPASGKERRWGGGGGGRISRRSPPVTGVGHWTWSRQRKVFKTHVWRRAMFKIRTNM